MAFDSDAFLADTGGFDSDAFIADEQPPVRRPVPPEQKLSVLEKAALQYDKMKPDFDNEGLFSSGNVVDAASGLSTMMRGVGNFVSDGAGSRLWPDMGNKDGAARLTGEILDPAALVTGTKVAQTLPKIPVVGKAFAKAGAETVLGKKFVDALRSMGKNMTTGAATGTILGGLQDHGDATTGALIGGLIPLGTGTVGMARNAGRAIIAPMTEAGRTAAMNTRLNDMLGGGAQDVSNYIINSLRNKGRQTSSVGDMVAEMNVGRTDKVGSPLVAMENVIEKNPQFSDIAKSLAARQEADRVAKIASFARTPEKITEAKAMRDAVADPLRQEAMSSANLVNDATKIMQAPLKNLGFTTLKPDDVLTRVRNIKDARGNKSNPTIQSAMSAVEELIDNATSKKGGIPAEELHTLRKQAGNVIKKFSDENKSWDQKLTSGLLKDVNSAIDDSIEAAGGDMGTWNRYLDVFSKRSRGINQMETGQELLNALRSPTGQERGSAFANQARKIQQDAKSPLSKVQEDRVKEVIDDLAISDEKTLLGQGVNAGHLLDSSAKSIKIPHLLSRTGTIVNSGLTAVGHGADAKIVKDVGKLMLNDPQEFARKYLKKLPPEQIGPIVKMLRSAENAKYPMIQQQSKDGE